MNSNTNIRQVLSVSRIDRMDREEFEIETIFGPLVAVFFHDEECGLKVCVETPWRGGERAYLTINRIEVEGFAYWKLDQQNPYQGSTLSRKNTYKHNDATDAARRTFRATAEAAIEMIRSENPDLGRRTQRLALLGQIKDLQYNIKEEERKLRIAEAKLKDLDT